ncbi:MFS transporter [Pendulispora albinea]|uniref:MFS transporter n=1 Tax=Pendulispora albinea TaxID=2741071 RepID=A0ABZ2LYE4_9BACT
MSSTPSKPSKSDAPMLSISAAPPGVRRVIALSNAFQLLFGLLFWLPIFYVYQRRIGLSDPQIFGIQSIYYVVFCLLEIPTGLFADRFDYRRSVRAGAVVLAVANLMPIILSSYTGFLAHFVLIALARSLVSGAFSAYLYDYLNARGAKDIYRAAEGRGRAYSLIGRVACLPVAGWLMEWLPAAPYWLSAASAAGAAFIALRLPEVALADGSSAPAAPERLPMARLMRHALHQLREAPHLPMLMLQGVALFTLVRIVQVNLFQPILGSKQLPLSTFGLIMAGTTVCEIAGAFRSGWLRRWFSNRTAVFVLTWTMALALAALVPAGSAGTVVALCVFSVASGLSFPIQRQLLNDAIVDSTTRATLLSMESIVDRGVCAVVAVFLGDYIAQGRLHDFLVRAALATAALMALTAVGLRLTDRRAGRGAHGEQNLPA